MTDLVRASTTDLELFVTNGVGYRRTLTDLLTHLEDRRSTVTSALAHEPETDWIVPFRQLLADAADNDRFVEHIVQELAHFSMATIDLLAAEIDAWTGHPGDGRLVELQAALAAEIEWLSEGDRRLAIEIARQVGRGVPAVEALFDGVGAVYRDEPLGTVLERLEQRELEPGVVDPIGYALLAHLIERVEAFTGADLAEVDLGVAVLASDNDLTYNAAVALLNLDLKSGEGDWPPGTPPFTYIDQAITSGHEAALMLLADEEGLFRSIETARQGDLGRWDGRLSDEDWRAVLADPTDHTAQAVAIARFFAANPDEWSRFDTARDGVALLDLADGRYRVGDGDGITSFADVEQYITNHQLFDVLSAERDRTGGVLVDHDGDGRLDEAEFQRALADLEAGHPNFAGLRDAITYALEAELLTEPDTRAWYEQIGGGLYRVTSLFPGSPTHLHRLVTDPAGQFTDQLSFARGAGGAVVAFGQFAYDASAMNPAGPGFWVEHWRVDGDPSRHRGIRLTQAIPPMATAALSLVPGTPQFHDALAEVRRQGTWDAHPGLSLGRAAVDWEGFVDDPAEWAGRLAPELVITVLSGGGGSITRLGTTGSRLAAAFRRLVVRAGTGVPRLPFPSRTRRLPDADIAERQAANAVLRDGPSFDRDLTAAGVDRSDIAAMFQQRKPLGFASEVQFADFTRDLERALDAAGLDDAEIGLKGTATTFYSENPGKPLGHHWDADPANPGDYDLNITSDAMVARLEGLGLEPHPQYGVFRTRDINGNFDALEEFAKRWGDILGRDVNFVGYPEPTARDLTEYVLVGGP